VIQSGFQGLTEGKQAAQWVKREAGRDGEERATDLFDGKLQRCLEGTRRLTALELNTAWSLYLLRTFPPASWLGHGQPPNIYLFLKKSLSSLSFVPIRPLVPSCAVKPSLGQSEFFTPCSIPECGLWPPGSAEP